ncbi:MAG: galactokinase [Pirellulales bacterium]|nr:galactokinase [Pirellulales bacterium]
MPIGQAEISARFANRFGHLPNWIVRAPGRVNLIGEHTDYNDGFVLPMAIDRAVWIALRPRDDRIVSVYSIDYDETGEFSLDELVMPAIKPRPSVAPPSATDGRGFISGWIEYLKGTAWSLQEAGHRLTGWDGVLAGDVPLGAGLSSSAALEMAVARAFAAAGKLPWEPAEMAKLGQRAENQWVGVNCGIMDQLISAAGRAGNALLIDCRSLQTEPVPLPQGTSVVVLDTSTRRGLVDSAYNERRRQCEQAARLLDVHALRDATTERLERSADKMDPAVLSRARHVIAENDRTLLAAAAMRRGDAAELGRLMHQSHRSLRDDYEVSSDALNAMVECASAQRECFGARMTGAGFGGCAVALVRAEATDDFARDVAAAYERKTGHSPAVYVCQAADGAEVMWETSC